ncbi:MAG: GNAT family N-acetyltransferase [Ornithinimicrobium sp.]|uniref:GNAT family N-acetyltransferase n=1 Tax=Ornithinimicrobium sp. TaxID=1977084 RepID=UPI0026E073EF|nr:GNAT family N-acetyltransferase [Ornithinimicrobium sp.]MDO5741041.1 GNAT family N-acetyltransferase [Ornithinimicrobium sp.]
MSEVVTRPRCDVDIPALIDILARQQAQTQYPFHWPPDRGPERFLRRPSEREAWVAELDGKVVGHVAIQSVADDELGRLWASAHGVPITELRCISVLYADRRHPRRGIGSALLARATERALAGGGAPVLDVVAGHLDAVNLYLSRGWQEVGRIRPQWLPASEEPVHAMILPRPGVTELRVSAVL